MPVVNAGATGNKDNLEKWPLSNSTFCYVATFKLFK